MHPDLGYPAHARRTLEEVLGPRTCAALRAVCVDHVAPKVEPAARMAYLSSLAMDDDRWRPIIAAALATDPDLVESWLLGTAIPVPGSLDRRSAHTGILSFAAAEKAETVERQRAQHRAREAARERAHAHHDTPLPREWWATARQTATVQQVAKALDMTITRAGIGPCPACTATTRGGHDKRPPIVPRRDGQGWTCYACSATGDALHLACHVLIGARKWADREQRETVGRWFASHGWC